MHRKREIAASLGIIRQVVDMCKCRAIKQLHQLLVSCVYVKKLYYENYSFEALHAPVSKRDEMTRR